MISIYFTLSYLIMFHWPLPEVQFSQTGEKDCIQIDRQKVLEVFGILGRERIHRVITCCGERST